MYKRIVSTSLALWLFPARPCPRIGFSLLLELLHFLRETRACPQPPAVPYNEERYEAQEGGKAGNQGSCAVNA